MSTKYIASNWRLPNKAGVDSYLNDNYGLTFDGSSEYIDLGNDSALTPENITISCWVNITDGGHINGYYVSKIHTTGSSASYGINKKQPEFFVRTTGGSYVVSPQADSIVDAGWTHLVGTYDGSYARLYVNGVEVQTGTAGSGAIDYTTEEAYIGAFEYYTPTSSLLLPIEGKISEVAIFDYALSESQISSLYGSSSLGAGNPMALKPAPVAFYPLGDNSSGNPLTQPNEAVEDASVFDFNPSSNQYINCGNILDQSGTDAFSISGWFYLNSTKSNTIVSKMNSSFVGYQLYVNAANKLKFLLQGTGNLSATGSTVLSLNTWYNVILTYDGSGTTGGINLFLNGATESFTGSGSNSGGVSNSENFEIGARTGAVDEMDGLISNVAIWNSDQSAEISNIYNSGVPATTYTNTPTAWYKLDQSANWDVSGSGYWDIPDASGNGNDGISSGMTSANLVLTNLTRNLPYDSYSFNFDAASSDYIDIGNFQPSTTALSISAWAYKTDTSQASIIGRGASVDYGIFVFGGSLQFGLNTGAWGTISISGFTSSYLNQWVHVCATWDGSTMKLYLNGVEGATASKTGTITYTSNDTTIGKNSTLSGFEWDGKISNVSIFNEGLTSTEVMKLYSNGMPQDLTNFTPAPIAWWTLGSNSFFNGSNFICKDLIGTNDGTSFNAGVDALQGNTPRSEANGTGTNMDIPTNLKGTTKYSSNNSYSINMSNTARVQDTP